MKKLLFFTILLLFFDLFSETVANVGIGTKWNSNSGIDNIYLTERLSKKELDNNSDSALAFEGDIELSKENGFNLNYSIFGEYYVNNPRYSRINHYAGSNFNIDLSDNSYMNLSLTLHNEIEDFSSFSNVKNLYSDILLNSSFYYDISKRFIASLSIKGSYFYNFDNRMSYLKGPAGGGEVSIYFYPSSSSSFFRIGSGAEIFNFAEESMVCNECSEALTIDNKYYKLFGFMEAELPIGNFIFKGSFFYFFTKWIEDDKKTTWQNKQHVLWLKKRRDHTFLLTSYALYKASKIAKVKGEYSFKKSISTIGEKAIDYNDYNFVQHIVSIYFIWGF